MLIHLLENGLHHVKAIAPDVLRHRILPTYEAEADGRTPDDLVKTILEKVDQH
ncbi:MAG: hypothetical protein AAGA48_35700 [Myxococcota bacterium]